MKISQNNRPLSSSSVTGKNSSIMHAFMTSLTRYRGSPVSLHYLRTSRVLVIVIVQDKLELKLVL